MNIPFTTEQFFEVIATYNQSVFPMQIIFLVTGALALIFLHVNKPSGRNYLIGGFIGILWIWTGIVYHLAFFTAINKAAYGFGVLFIIQGLLFLYETFMKKKLEFEFTNKPILLIGYFFIWFGLIIYPILIYFMESSINNIITLGLPCPTTILTFGFLMLTVNKFPKYLLIIPSIWTLIGTSAAFNFGVYPDYLMLVAAIIANVYLLGRKRIKEK